MHPARWHNPLPSSKDRACKANALSYPSLSKHYPYDVHHRNATQKQPGGRSLVQNFLIKIRWNHLYMSSLVSSVRNFARMQGSWARMNVDTKEGFQTLKNETKASPSSVFKSTWLGQNWTRARGLTPKTIAPYHYVSQGGESSSLDPCAGRVTSGQNVIRLTPHLRQRPRHPTIFISQTRKEKFSVVCVYEDSYCVKRFTDGL